MTYPLMSNRVNDGGPSVRCDRGVGGQLKVGRELVHSVEDDLECEWAWRSDLNRLHQHTLVEKLNVTE